MSKKYLNLYIIISIYIYYIYLFFYFFSIVGGKINILTLTLIQ